MTQKIITQKWRMTPAIHQMVAHLIILGVILIVQIKHSVCRIRQTTKKNPDM